MAIKWRTKDNRLVELHEFDDKHLRNTFRMVKRQFDDPKTSSKRAAVACWLTVLRAEMKRRDVEP
jgi:hypothetical protein